MLLKTFHCYHSNSEMRLILQEMYDFSSLSRPMILKVGSSKCRSAAPQNNRKCSVSNSAGHILNQDSRDGSQQAMF